MQWGHYRSHFVIFRQELLRHGSTVTNTHHPIHVVHIIQSNYLGHSPCPPFNQEAVLSWEHMSGYFKRAPAVTSSLSYSSSYRHLLRRKMKIQVLHCHSLQPVDNPFNLWKPLMEWGPPALHLCADHHQRGVSSEPALFHRMSRFKMNVFLEFKS